MPDTLQPIDLREAVSCKDHIVAHRKMIRRLTLRVGGAHIEGASEALIDAEQYLADAEDAVQRHLDERSPT